MAAKLSRWLIRNILTAIGLVTIDVFATAVVRTHQFTGSIAADGRVEISGASFDSTPPQLHNIVRSVEVDANGNVRNAVDTQNPGSTFSDGSVEISDGSTELIPQNLQNPVRSVEGSASGNVRNAAEILDKVLSNRGIVNGIEYEKHLVGRGSYMNESTVSPRIQTLSKAVTFVEDVHGEKHGGELHGTLPNTTRQQTWWQSLNGFLTTQFFNYELRKWISSTLVMKCSALALHQTRGAFMTLLLLTIMFVIVGFVLAVFFPDQRLCVVKQTMAFTRDLARRIVRPEPKRLTRLAAHAENDFLKNFEIGEKLGEGAFGVVHVVFSRQDGNKYAAKMIDVMGTDLDLINEEIAILKRVQHASLTVCCLHAYHDQCFYYLVMPIYHGGDLSGAVCDYINSEGLLSERLFANIFGQMARGVAFVHSKWVVHRDIKPENFLLQLSKLDDPENRVVVTDFGMSAVLNDGAFLEEICGTPIFMSPELFEGKYEFKVDVFALGLSAYALLTGTFAFNTEQEIMAWASSSDPPPIPPSISPYTQEIVEKSLARDVSQRVNAKDLENLAAKLQSRSLDENMLVRSESLKPKVLADRCSPTLGIGEGEIQENKWERRRRMIWEMVRAREGRTMAFYAGGPNISAEVLEARSFEIKGGRRNRKVSRFEFWSLEDCSKSQVSGIDDTQMKPLDQITEVLPSDVQLLDDVLERYTVDRTNWDQGRAKSVTDLAQECKGGVCFLTESEKRLERVVEILALVVRDRKGNIIHQFPLIPKAALGKANQSRAPPSRCSRRIIHFQTSFTQPRLPAKKMEAWETVHEATDRALDMLNMSAEDVDLNFSAPMRVVKETSASYPGLTTVYKKHMVEASIREEECSSERLAFYGLPDSKKFVTKTKEGALNWGWLSQADAEQIGTLDVAEEGLAMRYAEVLPVKSKVITGDRIKDMLRTTNADVDAMSHQALEELAEQVRKGEVELVEEEQHDGTRSLKRKVTVTMLRLAHPGGSVLLEVSKSMDGGTTWKNTSWLPATKQHTFENPYYVARRLLTSRFMVAEGNWRIDKDKGGCIREESESAKLPGLPTIYFKNVISARLC